MSSYEFWDELGRIFNAVVAYQEKNLEFNKRFISPWIRLGNIFEKQDRNNEAMHAYERAIEIDEANPQNWFELGNIHFKMENHPDAVSAFNRAIELDPGFGWAHNNLALTLATMGKTEKAVALYERAIDLLQDARDKAVAWNRLGNAYRKLNQYEHALEAFHKADELDRDNSGFRDSMDEVSAGPTLMAKIAQQGAGEAAEPVKISPIELIVAGDEAAIEAVAQDGAAAKALEVEPVQQQPETSGDEAANAVDAFLAGGVAASEESNAAEIPGEAATDREPELIEETVTVVVPDSTQTYTETLTIPLGTIEPAGGEPAMPMVDDPSSDNPANTEEVVTSDNAAAQGEVPVAQADAASGLIDVDATQANAAVAESESTAAEITEIFDPAPNSLADQLLEAEPEVLDVAQHVAYEAFLKDTNEPLGVIGGEDRDAEVELPGSPEPVAQLDESGELQIEMDTKNAHVWNELGNVYFNTSAYDDSIVAYSKAIELDRWFAWPYSNLALAYVQKRRFVEAILLYQRSIELFSSDKDKAISWNRLGNVYRRLNDYENAIAAYQRADALDPDNSTLSLQSRFSLLGNYAVEQKPSYVS